MNESKSIYKTRGIACDRPDAIREDHMGVGTFSVLGLGEVGVPHHYLYWITWSIGLVWIGLVSFGFVSNA
jgi:hypothetical protein